MRHTLKAVFDNRSDAQHVLEELLASGYTHADVALSDSDDATPEADHHEGFGASVRHTFDRLFGSKHHAAPASEPAPSAGEAMHGHHVVLFTTESEPEAERAAGIIGRFGPAGIEEHHEPSGQDSAAFMPGVAAIGDWPPGTEPGSLQYRTLDDGYYFGTQNAASRPSGNTYQDSMGAASHWRHPDEEMAYRYGKNMGASDSYRDHSWEEAEPSLQSAWERTREHGEASAWHRIREAVRQGWDRVKARQGR
ncbi:MULTISPECIES: hypothetical protein [unclassified Massilia]|uniref:hypothetical protein n=1 Tax=unclassified Massilia TaxID=2609279 RepID=UPI000AD00AA6|nr:MULTISPECIES: hypothetical protein [unclassified Massilia]